MIRKIRTTYWTKIFTTLLLIQFINTSIDTPDLSVHTKQLIPINAQESIVELVLEKCFGFENAIPEYYDTESDTQQKNKVKIHWFTLFSIENSERFGEASHSPKKQLYIQNQPHFSSPDFEIQSPPPEV
jgi:hypothetical protein